MSTSIRVISVSKVTISAVDSGTHIVRIKSTGPQGPGIGSHESTYDHDAYDAHLAATSGIHGLTGAPAEATDVATNTADIAQNTSDIVSLQNQDILHTADIATNAADILTNAADIATNTADIATNTADIATNTADIATNTADIATNAADILTNAGNIATNAADIDALEAVHTNTLDPTGWVDNTAIASTYDSTTRTITLTGDLRYYWQGELKELTSPWTSDAHSATLDDTYFLYSSDGTTFSWSTTVWPFYDLMAGFVNYGTSDKYGVVETHGTMPWQTHKEFHARQGTYKEAGGTLSSYTLASTTAADRRPVISATELNDEDIATTLPTQDVGTDGTVQYTLSGATPTTVFNTGATDIVPLSGNHPYWNENSGGTWQQTLMSNNSYMSVWLVGLPAMADTESQSYRYWWVQGQSNGSLVSEQAKSVLDLTLTGIPSITPEFTFLAKVIIRYTGGNWSLTQVDILSGTRSQITSGASGNYLSIVTTDATLTGAGTTGSPLGVVDDGHTHDTQYAPVLGADDNYVTDAEKVVIGNTSGTNTGDQVASDFNHDDLSNITGTAGQYNHPTDAQMTVLGNTSGTNTGDQNAAGVGITDSGDYFTGTDVEAALQELGAAGGGGGGVTEGDVVALVIALG